MEGGEVILKFGHAYIHQSEGVPGVDAGTDWSQVAIIRIVEAMVEGTFSEWPRELWDGHLKLDGTLFDNMIPNPIDQLGPVELRLEGWGEVVSIIGTHIKLELIGEARYIEEFKPRF